MKPTEKYVMWLACFLLGIGFKGTWRETLVLALLVGVAFFILELVLRWVRR